MFPIGGNNSAAVEPIEVTHSIRVDGINDFVTKTYTASTLTYKKFTLSLMVKRGKLGGLQTLFSGGATGTGYIGDYLCFDSNNKLAMLYDDSANPIGPYATSRVFNDTSAWYHIVIAFDTDQAVQADRCRLWVNGVPEAISNGLGLSAPVYFLYSNAGGKAKFGQRDYANDSHFEGNYAHICCVPGAALTASDFGTTRADGKWVSKLPSQLTTVVNTHADARGFALIFENGTNTTTLGYDSSSKGNNFTLTNMVRDGSTDDCWSFDTPSNNFAVLSALDKTSGVTLSGTGLKASLSSPYNTNVRASFAVSSGKWAWEYVQGVGSGNYSLVGVADITKEITDVWRNTPNGWYYSGYNGYKFTNSGSAAYGATYTNPNVIRVELDMDAGTLEFFKDGVSQGVAYSGLSGRVLAPAFHDSAAAVFGTFNFGQTPVSGGAWDAASGGYFRHAPTAGFKALNTRNLQVAGAAAEPRKHFDVKVRAGTGAAGAVTGLQFAPDLGWTKTRNGVSQHVLTDRVRGVNKQLFPSDVSSEQTTASWITSFNADGFSFAGQISGMGDTNSSGGAIYADWLWKAGGAPVANNSGSITSQVSANPAAGCSILTYTGTGANATVGHGLGVAPKMVIVKARGIGGENWNCWHAGLPSTAHRLLLNAPDAQDGASSTVWNSNINPTSTTFSIGTSSATNGNAVTYVAYCFAEIPGYSRIGSYVGNGSAEGPFVWCGFKPRFVLVKSMSASGAWEMIDTARSPSNPASLLLRTNSTASELDAVDSPEIFSNGFRPRNTNGNLNDTGVTYSFYAISDQHFKLTGAR